MKFPNKIKHRRIAQNQLTTNLIKKSKYIVKYATHRVKERLTDGLQTFQKHRVVVCV